MSAAARPGGEWAADHPAVAHVLLETLADACTIDGSEGHHLTRVRRLREGAVVTAADGTGEWRPYRVAAIERGSARVVASGAARREPELTPRLAVAFALTKGDKPERVVRHLTELGVDRILPIVTARSVMRWSDAEGAAGVDRLRRVARAAVEQCRRARVPTVEALGGLDELAGHPTVLVAGRSPASGDDPAPDGAPPSIAAAALPFAAEWLLVVGPEGGFAPGELQHVAPVGRVTVGPHVLRAETAALAAASVLTATRRSGLR